MTFLLQAGLEPGIQALILRELNPLLDFHVHDQGALGKVTPLPYLPLPSPLHPLAHPALIQNLWDCHPWNLLLTLNPGMKLLPHPPV